MSAAWFRAAAAAGSGPRPSGSRPLARIATRPRAPSAPTARARLKPKRPPGSHRGRLAAASTWVTSAARAARFAAGAGGGTSRPRVRRASISSIGFRSLREGIGIQVLPGVAEQFTDSAPSAMEPRSHRPDRDPQRHGDLLVPEVGPGEEEQDVAVAGREMGQGVANRRSRPGRVESGLDSAEAAVRASRAVETRVSPEPSRFAPMVVAQEVRGDPEQPGARVWVLGVI